MPDRVYFALVVYITVLSDFKAILDVQEKFKITYKIVSTAQ